MSNVPEMFGSLVFNDTVMKARLPKSTYKALQKTRMEGKPLDPEVANVVANEMKCWAVEHGDGKVIMEFSGKELINGEPDASSFPSGGLRATFEARGYTAWDPTSDAFIKDGSLCIPTAFCSYGGEALDKKTPLLRSMEALSKQAVRVLRLFGDTTTQRVNATVGPEQEYFLVDDALYAKRKDLVYTGRTLFGAKPPKGQEMDDPYFGVLKPRVSAYMKDLDSELWKLGILAKTKHNEVAPAQHELAPIFSSANVATDDNQLTMEMMKKVAAKHGMACLLHEKPFDGVNGSGKHDNWAIATDTGRNLLDPGASPRDNAQFLLFLCAVIEAVDEHQDLLRISVASAGNDHRLGANEAPPATVSTFLGSELTEVLESIANGTPYIQKERVYMHIGSDVLPDLPKDTTDRNRTSPFAFTGNKFEFRMLGSSQSIACPNIMLNTAVADVLANYAEKLEKADDFNAALQELISETYKAHKRIIFNGNNYSDEWVKEAEKRGLLNLRTLADATPHYVEEKNIAMFERHHVLTRTEVEARCDIELENYWKQLNIEALTMVDMINKDIIPAVCSCISDLSQAAVNQQTLGLSASVEKTLLAKISPLAQKLYEESTLRGSLLEKKDFANNCECARYYCDKVLAQMETARAIADELELSVGRKYWPFPSYGDLLFSVR